MEVALELIGMHQILEVESRGLQEMQHRGQFILHGLPLGGKVDTKVHSQLSLGDLVM